MKWHLILMIVWSLLYIAWKIYSYSTSIEITYYKPSTGKMCDFKRWKNRIKYYIKGYFKWYRFEHFKTILLVWLIYGGFLYGNKSNNKIMTQYIDKAAVVAKIKELIRENELYLSENVSDTVRFSKTGNYSVLNDLLHFINTLEVKDLKEEPVSKDLEEAISQSFIYHKNRGDDFRSDNQIETAYRCGFETCAKYYKELASITKDIEKQTTEVKEVNLEKEIKDYFDNQPIITRSKGIDYQLIPSGEDIAKHFFELGLKAQNGYQIDIEVIS